MKKYNLLAAMFLAMAAVSCGDDTKKENAFSIDTTNLKQQYNATEKAELSIANPSNKEIDSVVYLVNGKRAGSVKGNAKFTLDFAGHKLGYQDIQAQVYSGGHGTNTDVRVELMSSIDPKVLSYDIVNTYPHDMTAYTQGLEFYRDTLIESTGSGAGRSGKRAVSDIRKVNPKTGEVYKKTPLDRENFGEGATVLNGKIYQLTYQRNEGYVYDANTLKKLKTVPYYKAMEGWGLTNDGKNLYMTDGSEKIYTINPETFKQIDYVNVYTRGSKIGAVNELEWVDGKIYGNIYQKDAIAIINPKTGEVEGVLDLSALKAKVNQHIDLDVLNGIAYNPKTKTFFVTGKNWDKMFEIRIKG